MHLGLLTARVEKWYESYNILSDAQFGFRKRHRTVDAIFALHNLKTRVTFAMCVCRSTKGF
jgi:hypothetical protein